VETRQVKNDYTIQFERQRYGIEAPSISKRLRGGEVRVEKRLDGSLAVRFRDRYLNVNPCAVAPPAAAPVQTKAAAPRSPKSSSAHQKSHWMDDFLKKPGPSLAKALEIANATS
jgi:hypothetical protein